MDPILPRGDGIRLPLGTRIADRPHARRGGRPYPKEDREMVVQIWLNAGGDNRWFDKLDLPRYHQLRFQGNFPHMGTCQRWVVMYKSEGHVLPKRATGNRFATREIKGEELFQLALFCLV